MLTSLYQLAASPIGKGIASAVLSYTAHYVVVKAYSTACVPDGIYGYLQGLISTGSPVCQAGIQVMSATQISYSTMITMGITRVFIDLVAPEVGK